MIVAAANTNGEVTAAEAPNTATSTTTRDWDRDDLADRQIAREDRSKVVLDRRLPFT